MRKSSSLYLLATLFLVACGGSANNDSFPAQPPTGAETPLFNEINKVRLAAGKKALIRSSKLNVLAASESSRLAASAGSRPNISTIRERSGYGRAAVLVGNLKDRGPETGSSYPGYWIKSESEKSLLLNDWHRIGVGTAKSPNGDLVSIVIFGDLVAASLMKPM